MENNSFMLDKNNPFIKSSNFKKKQSKSIQSIKQNHQQNQYERILKPLNLKNITKKNRFNSLTNIHRNKKYYSSVHEHCSYDKDFDNLIKNQTQFKMKTKRNKKLLTQNSNNKICNQIKNDKKISQLMKQQRKKFNITLRQNDDKKKYSYKNNHQSILKYDFINIHKIRQSQDKEINIKLQFKSKKKLYFNQQIKYQNKIKKQYKSQTVKDIFVKQNNLFNIQIQSTACYDSIFPLFRNGSTLISIGGKYLYLYGGINSKLIDSFHFHQYSFTQKIWTSIKNQQNKPQIIPSYHTVQVYKNYLIFIGGTYFGNPNNKINHKYNSNILIYDTQNNKWQKLKWRKYIKYHSSTIYGNMLVIYGGINQKGQYSNKLYFLPLNTNNIFQSNIYPYNLNLQNEQGIAYHKLINTYQLDQSYKNKQNLDGIICYGGKYENDKINKQLKIFRFHNNIKNNNNKNNILDRQYINNKKWQIIQTKGIKPQNRYNHTMNLLNKKNIFFIIGGLNQKQYVLNDIWIFDLNSLNWIQAIFDCFYPILQKQFFIIINRGIYNHTTTTINNQIFVFGGIDRQNKHNNQFWSIQFSYNRALKKQQQMKKTRQFIGTCKVNKQFSLFQDGSQM